MKIYRNLLFTGCYDGFIYVHRKDSNKVIGKLHGPGKMLLDFELVDNKVSQLLFSLLFSQLTEFLCYSSRSSPPSKIKTSEFGTSPKTSSPKQTMDHNNKQHPRYPHDLYCKWRQIHFWTIEGTTTLPHLIPKKTTHILISNISVAAVKYLVEQKVGDDLGFHLKNKEKLELFREEQNILP